MFEVGYFPPGGGKNLPLFASWKTTPHFRLEKTTAHIFCTSEKKKEYGWRAIQQLCGQERRQHTSSTRRSLPNLHTNDARRLEISKLYPNGKRIVNAFL